MRRDDIMAILSRRQKEIRALGVESLALFGSAARNEAGPESDVDLLVEFDRPMGIFGLLDIKYRLEEILDSKVDLVTRSGVHLALRDRIFAEAINVL